MVRCSIIRGPVAIEGCRIVPGVSVPGTGVQSSDEGLYQVPDTIVPVKRTSSARKAVGLLCLEMMRSWDGLIP